MFSSTFLAPFGFQGGNVGGFYGGDFGTLLLQWEQMGVFSFILPFLLIFSLIYGVLSKMNLFGDPTNKSINAIISLSVALMSLQFGVVSVFFSNILPLLGVALGGVLVFLILIGLFGNPNSTTLSNTMMWGSFAVAGLIVVLSLDIFGPSGRGFYLLNLIPYNWIPWIAIVALVAVIVSSAKSPSELTPAGHFFDALAGRKN